MSVVNLNTNPLISVIVITYNSSKFVLETLESVKAQTYQNIELIISDDCSTDTTIGLCETWLKKNKEYFVSSQLILATKNTGIPANCNRGLKTSKGTWIKYIAGDDTLNTNCIAVNVNYILKHKNHFFIQTLMSEYDTSIVPANFLQTNPNQSNFYKFELDSLEQFKVLIYENFVNAPALFMHKETLENVQGFNEAIRTIEDYPLLLKITKKGYKVYFLNENTVNYRLHKHSVRKQGKPYLTSSNVKDRLLIYKNYRKQYMNLYHRIGTVVKYKGLILLDKLGLNRDLFISKVAYNLLDVVYKKY